MITQYSFGMMTVNGDVYRKDLIILPDGSILHPWWRKSGHVLRAADIQPVIAASPSILVVGTGDPGRMKPDSEFVRTLEVRGITVSVMPTRKAMDEFNRLTEQGGRCAGCFHLTC